MRIDSKMVTAALMACAALSPLLVWLNLPITPLRTLVSVPTLLFSPGYLILRLRFAEGLRRLELYLLSVGLSLSITGVWAVVLDELGLPVLPIIVGAPLVAITLVAGGVNIWRESRRS